LARMLTPCLLPCEHRRTDSVASLAPRCRLCSADVSVPHSSRFVHVSGHCPLSPLLHVSPYVRGPVSTSVRAHLHGRTPSRSTMFWCTYYKLIPRFECVPPAHNQLSQATPRKRQVPHAGPHMECCCASNRCRDTHRRRSTRVRTQ
jgi:hypothetical protein